MTCVTFTCTINTLTISTWTVINATSTPNLATPSPNPAPPSVYVVLRADETGLRTLVCISVVCVYVAVSVQILGCLINH